MLALVFSVLFIIYSRNTGNSFWVYWAPYFLVAGALLLGIPVSLAQRRHLTRPEPVPSTGKQGPPRVLLAEGGDEDGLDRVQAVLGLVEDDAGG